MKLRWRRRFGKQERPRSLPECARHEAADGNQARATHSGRGQHAASIFPVIIGMMEKREFHPEMMPRRGEWTAWGLWAVISLALWGMHRLGSIPGWAWILWGFLLFAAASISLGNWMDRRTVLRLTPEGIEFENGLRHVRLGWNEVMAVSVFPSNLGRTVQVRGEQAHFRFKTLGEFKFRGETRGRTGFAAGEEILQEIVRRSGLRAVQEEGIVEYKR